MDVEGIWRQSRQDLQTGWILDIGGGDEENGSLRLLIERRKKSICMCLFVSMTVDNLYFNTTVYS